MFDCDIVSTCALQSFSNLKLLFCTFCKLLFIIHNFRVAFRVANISILADFIVKLRTIVYNKANTKIKKTGKYAYSAYLPVEIKKADDGNRTRDLRLTKATLYRLSHISIGVITV